MYDLNRAFNLLKEISFERIGGSDNELKAANILKDTIIKDGLNPIEEEFLVDHSEIITATLKVLLPYEKTYEVHGVKMSGNTKDEGISGELVYIEDVMDNNILDIENKIVLLNSRMIHKYYEKLIAKKPAAFIAISGSIYDNIETSDLDIFSIREKDYSLGKIPGVCIRAIDAQELLIKQAKIIHLVLKQNESKITSRNIICDIKGTTYPNDIIAITSHYDSVAFSSGAYDNASGSVTIMELFHYFSKNPPKRTLRFIWCGSEELGLLGSKAHVLLHEFELQNYLYCLNVDMVGVVLGKNIAVSTAEVSLVSYISYLACELGIPLLSTQGVYSSDSTPFADKGIPSTSFARISPSGGAKIHCRKDMIFPLNERFFESALNFLTHFLKRLDEAHIFPIPRIIPNNMKDELDIYNLRKK